MTKTHAVLKALVYMKYFTWEIEGAHHLPRQGPVVYAMNHAGWFALDTIMVGCSVAESVGVSRAPYFAAIDSSLAAPVMGPYLKRIGGLPASLFRHPQRLPAEFESYGICPEGVLGNCKPFWEAYRVRPWNRGFVRLAMALKAPVVPVAVFGGEECLPVAWTVKVLEPLIGSIVGLPLVPVPLPARWRIVFHEPEEVTTPGGPARRDPEHCNAIARRLRGIVQETLDREAAGRPVAYLSSFVAAVQRARKMADALDRDPLLGPEAALIGDRIDDGARRQCSGSAMLNTTRGIAGALRGEGSRPCGARPGPSPRCPTERGRRRPLSSSPREWRGDGGRNARVAARSHSSWHDRLGAPRGGRVCHAEADGPELHLHDRVIGARRVRGIMLRFALIHSAALRRRASHLAPGVRGPARPLP